MRSAYLCFDYVWNRKLEILGGLGLLAIAGWIILESRGIINIVSFSPPVQSNDFSQIVAGIGSLVLTYTLALLYKQQTSIQHRQERWMSASHRPELEFTSWRARDNELSFELSNLGNGVAKNLAVSVAICEYPEPRIMQDKLTTVSPLFRSNPLVRSLEEGTSEPKEFVSDPIPHFKGSLFGEQIDGRFHDVIECFEDEGFDSVSFTVTVEYDLIREESNEICVWAGTVDVEEELDLGAAIEKSTPNWKNIEIDTTPENI